MQISFLLLLALGEGIGLATGIYIPRKADITPTKSILLWQPLENIPSLDPAALGWTTTSTRTPMAPLSNTPLTIPTPNMPSQYTPSDSGNRNTSPSSPNNKATTSTQTQGGNPENGDNMQPSQPNIKTPAPTSTPTPNLNRNPGGSRSNESNTPSRQSNNQTPDSSSSESPAVVKPNGSSSAPETQPTPIDVSTVTTSSPVAVVGPNGQPSPDPSRNPDPKPNPSTDPNPNPSSDPDLIPGLIPNPKPNPHPNPNPNPKPNPNRKPNTNSNPHPNPNPNPNPNPGPGPGPGPNNPEPQKTPKPTITKPPESSSSSCTKSVATSCADTVNCSYKVGGQSTCSTTSSCETITSCSATDTTTTTTITPTATPDLQRYIITFKDDAPEDKRHNFTETLKREVPDKNIGAVVGDDKKIKLVVAVIDSHAVEQWKSEIVKKIQKDGTIKVNEFPPEEGGTYSSGPQDNAGHGSSQSRRSLEERKGPPHIVHLKGVDRRLKFISQEKGVSFKDMAGFSFDSRAGEKVNIYLIDSGLYKDHLDFKYDPDAEWERGIHHILPDVADKFGTVSQHYGPDDPTGHGTCLASLAVGNKYGVAKAANLLLSRIQVHGGRFIISSMIAATWGAVRDIQLQRKPSVVIIAWDWLEEWYDELYQPLKVLESLDVPVVVASGPDPTNMPYPAKYAEHLSNIVVAIEVDINGEFVPSSPTQGLPPGFIGAPVWPFPVRVVGNDWTKPGKRPGSMCAGTKSPDDVVRLFGSSQAAAQVAAMLAYIMSTHEEARQKGQIVKESVRILRELSYPRGDGFPPALWNGVEGLRKGASCPAPAGHQRRDGDGDGCSGETSSPSSPTPTKPTKPTSTKCGSSAPSQTDDAPKAKCSVYLGATGSDDMKQCGCTGPDGNMWVTWRKDDGSCPTH